MDDPFIIEMYRGDTREFTFPLTLLGEAWSLPGGVTLRSTGKLDKTDADDDAVFTKLVGSGLTVVDNEVEVAIVEADTDALADTGEMQVVFADVQVAGSAPPFVWTVMEYELHIFPDVSRTSP
jgi:hypothetical protein